MISNCRVVDIIGTTGVEKAGVDRQGGAVSVTQQFICHCTKVLLEVVVVCHPQFSLQCVCLAGFCHRAVSGLYCVSTTGRLKTQVRKTKVPQDGICKYGIRKYEYATVENIG